MPLRVIAKVATDNCTTDNDRPFLSLSPSALCGACIPCPALGSFRHEVYCLCVGGVGFARLASSIKQLREHARGLTTAVYAGAARALRQLARLQTHPLKTPSPPNNATSIHRHLTDDLLLVFGVPDAVAPAEPPIHRPLPPAPHHHCRPIRSGLKPPEALLAGSPSARSSPPRGDAARGGVDAGFVRGTHR